MDFPKSTSYQAVLEIGQVVGYDSVNHSVFVSLPSMQQIGTAVKLLINGPNDSSRVEQNPLPIMGTWGLVAILGGDPKSAIWCGAIAQSAVNAFTFSNPPTDEDGQTKYMSHASGAFSILDYYGNYFYGSPDGTTLALNATGEGPTIYRNSVDESGNQIAVEVPNTISKYRNTNPPGPFNLVLNHPSGSSISITPSGMVSIISGNPAQASITMTPSGIVTIGTGSNQASGEGPTIILNPVAKTVYIAGQKGLGAIQMDQNGNVTIVSAATIKIDAQGGDIQLDTSTHMDSVNTIISTFNSHVHSGVTSGSSDSGPPTTPLP